MKISWQ